MEITYSSNRLRKSVESFSAIKRYYGTRAKLVFLRKSELEAVSSLEDMKSIPAANCHQLFGNLKDNLAVDISGNHRIIYKPKHNPVPLKEEAGLDWSQVTKIEISQIGEDYH